MRWNSRVYTNCYKIQFAFIIFKATFTDVNINFWFRRSSMYPPIPRRVCRFANLHSSIKAKIMAWTMLNFIPSYKVFTASYPSASKTGDLKFSTLWNISQKFSTKSGQKMSSRSYRASRITNSRKLGNNSVDKIRHLAR